MQAERYILEFVEPTIVDFENNPTSVRHAFLACLVIFHCIDYLCPENSANQRKLFCTECPEFALVDRVAHAFKHVQSGHENSPTIKPLESASVIERPPGFLDVMFLDLSRFDDSIGGVTITNEVHLDLLETVKRAIGFLRGKLPVGVAADS